MREAHGEGCEEHGERLAALEVQMEDLTGNGQPGRVGKLETAIKNHDRLIWIGMGIMLALQGGSMTLHVISFLGGK